MSTDIESKMEGHKATQFWGGDARGACLQVTANGDDYDETFIQLTMEEAAALQTVLARFVTEEAKRRQVLLKKAIKDMEELANTVFSEIAELPDNFFVGPELAIKAISLYCPKV